MPTGRTEGQDHAPRLGLEEGSEVELSDAGPSFVVTPSSTPSLDVLLAAITDENLHAEIDTGPGKGQEAWRAPSTPPSAATQCGSTSRRGRAMSRTVGMAALPAALA